MLRSRLNLLNVLAPAFFCISNTFTWAQSAAEDANRSNNPLNLATSFNLQNYFAPGLFDANARPNDFLLRPILPPGPNGLVPEPQIFRMTLRSASSTFPMARISARPESGRSTFSAATITCRSVPVAVRHGTLARSSSTRSSNHSIRSRNLGMAYPDGRFLPA
jgi:hypothetical protein